MSLSSTRSAKSYLCFIILYHYFDSDFDVGLLCIGKEIKEIMIWYDMIWYDMIWYIWYDTIRYDTIRYDTIRYDMILKVLEINVWYPGKNTPTRTNPKSKSLTRPNPKLISKIFLDLGPALVRSGLVWGNLRFQVALQTLGLLDSLH